MSCPTIVSASDSPFDDSIFARTSRSHAPSVAIFVLVGISNRGGLDFELILPANWSPDQLHPVIVFLHGRGESGGFDVTNAQSLPCSC